MKITLICVGKLKEDFYTAAVAEYAKRLSAYCEFRIIQVEDEKTPNAASMREQDVIKDKEGERILKKIEDKMYVVALCIDGKQPDSMQFSDFIERNMTYGESSMAFIIGGSLGLSKAVLDRADYKLSFSKMTFPHQLMRVIFAEQLYRAFKIMNNEPYHK